MKKNISNRLTLTMLCTLFLVSTFFVGNVSVYAAEHAESDRSGAFTINYDSNSANGAIPSDNAIYSMGESVVIIGAEELSKDGKTFVGWSETPNGTTADFTVGETIKIQKDMTLYAVWSSNKTTEPVVILSNSGQVRRTQMGAASDSFFPDRTFVAGN